MFPFSKFPRIPFPSLRVPILWRITGGLLLILGVFGVYWVLLLQGHQTQRQDLEQQTQLRAGQTARALAAQVEALFSGLDFAAQNLIMQYQKNEGDGFALAVQTALQAYPQNAILQIAVVDRDGLMQYSSLQTRSAGGAAVSIRDREHFRVHAQGTHSGLYVSQPVLGRVSGQWTIQLSRAIRVGDQFAGVVVVSVSPSYLSGFFRDILDQPNDVVLLLRNDGFYLARSRDEAAVMGKAVPAQREFLLDPGKSHGVYETAALVDKVDRYYAWARPGKFPVVVSVGLDKEAALAGLTPIVRSSLWRNGFSTVLLLAGAITIGWLARQRHQTQLLLTAGEERLRKLVAQVPGALFQFRVRADGSTSFPYTSPGIYDLHRVTPAEAGVDGKAALHLLHPQDAQRVREEVVTATRQLTAWHSQYRVCFQDGTERWLHGSANPEREPDGSVLWHGYIHDVTQDRAVQQALHTSEERLRLTLQAVLDGLWQWDLKHNRVHWDRRCCEMLGYAEPFLELDYDGVLQRIHPKDHGLFQQKLSAHLERGESYRMELRLRTASGGWLWVEARGDVSDTVDGKPTRMLGTHTDVSARMEQAQLRRALLDESAAAIFLATPERTISMANARAEELFGAPHTRLPGQSMRLIHRDDESFQAFKANYAALRTNGSVQSEWALKMGNGTVRWCDMHGTLLDPQDPDGQVIWTLFDTDDRYRAETARVIAQQQLIAIIERFPGGLLLEDPVSGQILALNQTLCQMLGVAQAPAELVGQPYSALIENSMAEEITALFQTARNTDLFTQRPSHNVEYTLADGRTFDIHRIALAQQANPLGLLWLANEITDRKQRESTLERLATTDALTGLPNRRVFMERLHHELQAIHQGQRPGAVVLMLDIDFFKKVNDTWGHAVGDLVLQHLAHLLRDSLRQDDLAGRLGGEEFALLLPDTDAAGGLALAERLRESVAHHAVPAEGGDIAFTISLGISVLDRQALDINMCLNRADAAMYHSKHHGRNRVTAWSAGMDSVPAPHTR